ncbi:MAG TPA: DegT/DnrJ/EryC1/StrS family aminotransferase [Candidatus Sumerlaeota bacterium]|nr:DegT/DnrJ/EryC1/StrS family aminotransferase [Candidatus Sumerlaeota bacterium]HPS00374.1 DegT/DnrJ/EryC1/StrS family aminotransferase [Candidatus Sumerlaeota bacterium]
MKVPFLDLKAQYLSIKPEILTALENVLDRTAFAGGPFVEEFEKGFASYCGCKHAIGVGNGTDALWFSLLALGVGPGDEVITVPNTFIATAEAITFCGAKPVFVDVDEATFNMNPKLVEAAITPRTKAIIPVHLYGQTADLDPILEVAARHGLPVVEDACQAHGALYKGRKAGSIGAAGCFSFYPGKNLGAYGEAGAIVTNDDELATKMRVLRDHGQTRKYYHAVAGWNGRMDGFQGAVLSVKLKRIEAWNEARRQHGARYSSLLSGLTEVRTPEVAEWAQPIYHVYALRTHNREQFIQAMAEKEIACAIHYPVPLHLQDAYRSLGYQPGRFPVAEKAAATEVSLPMFPELTDEQIEYVVECIKEIRK